MRELMMRIRLWWLERELKVAKQCLARLRRDIPKLEAEIGDMNRDLLSFEDGQPA